MWKLCYNYNGSCLGEELWGGGGGDSGVSCHHTTHSWSA